MCEWPDERQGFGRPSFNVQPVSGNAPTPQNSQGLSLFDYFLLLFFFFFCMRYIKCALCFIAKKESQETETDNDLPLQFISRLFSNLTQSLRGSKDADDR